MFSTDFCGKIVYDKSMSMEDLKTQISQKLAGAPQIGAKVKFDLGDEGMFWIDGTVTPPLLVDGDIEADTTFVCAASVLNGIIDGTQDPTMAYMMGKLRVQGSMGYAMKLNGFLAD